MTSTPLSRRRALSGAVTAGLSLPLLAACGDDGGDSTAADPTSETPSETSGEAPSAEPTSDGAPTEGVVSTADVPVGSGVILPDASVVVTQPTEGDIHVLSITCTHTGCAVTGISDKITCPCHGSSYDLTGVVLGGPAPKPLPDVGFTIEGDQVVLT